MILYTLQESTSSRCKECSRYVHLLIEKNPSPRDTPVFFICFECAMVSQAGVGELYVEWEA